MTVAYVSVGSNINKEFYIPAALQAIQAEFGTIVISSIYRSAAVGFDGDSFDNLVVSFASDLSAQQVAKRLRQIEFDHGRELDAVKFSSRTLDLDLILFGDQIIQEGSLQIPREDIERYAFVLEPLSEIAGEVLHPVGKISFMQLWQQFDKQGVQQVKLALSYGV